MRRNRGVTEQVTPFYLCVFTVQKIIPPACLKPVFSGILITQRVILLKVKALNRSGNAGFIGLMELLVIIGIIGILTIMSTPTYRALRQRAREATAIQDMGNLISPAISTYRIDIGEFPVPDPNHGNRTEYSLLSNPYAAGTSKYSRWENAVSKNKDGTRVTYIKPQSGTNPWLKDPWGQPYMIFSWGFTRCVVVSSGFNRTLDTDITATVSATAPDRTTGKFLTPLNNDDIAVVIE